MKGEKKTPFNPSKLCGKTPNLMNEKENWTSIILTNHIIKRNVTGIKKTLNEPYLNSFFILKIKQ